MAPGKEQDMVNRELFPERKSTERLAYEHCLRTGQRLTTAEWRCIHERKYNANHDPQNGQFTFGPSGSVPASGGGGANRGSRDRAATGSTPGAQTQQVRIPAPVKPDHIRAVMPYAGALADAYEKPLNDAMAAHGIDTPEQRAAFLAQIAVESGHLRRTAENLNYSAERIV